MSINVNTSFSLGAAAPIDDRLVLTKEQMLNLNENIYPEVYFCVCADDGLLYTFDKNNAYNDTTGKYRPLSSIKTWNGTSAEYAVIANTLEEGTIVTITDDEKNIIDDETISVGTTYSSSKINSIIGNIEFALDSIIGGD